MLLLIWAYFRLPETKGLTPEQLDQMFHEKLPARQLKMEAARFWGSATFTWPASFPSDALMFARLLGF